MEMPRNFESRENESVIYSALFVDDINSLKEKYPPVHPNEFYHHSTIAFQPKNGKNDLEVGKKYIIAINGRVTTDKIDALLVENKKATNDNPHITLSTAEGIKPFASNTEIEKAITEGTVIAIEDILGVTEGYFNGKKDVTN